MHNPTVSLILVWAHNSHTGSAMSGDILHVNVTYNVCKHGEKQDKTCKWSFACPAQFFGIKMACPQIRKRINLFLLLNLKVITLRTYKTIFWWKVKVFGMISLSLRSLVRRYRIWGHGGQVVSNLLHSNSSSAVEHKLEARSLETFSSALQIGIQCLLCARRYCTE